MKIDESIKYTLDDLRMVPLYSEIETRNIPLTSFLYTRSPEKIFKFRLPIVSSPMTTVTESQMLARMAINGALGIIHRFKDLKWTEEEIYNTHLIFKEQNSLKSENVIGGAIGINGDYIERANMLIECGVSVICVDVAHGHHILMKKALEELFKILPDDIHIMAGNIATHDGAKYLFDLGVDSIRVGIGGGAACQTQITTGCGTPLALSIIEAKRCKDNQHIGYKNKTIIADGGIKNSGDVAKVLALGADFAMLGSLLAGTKASPGEVMQDSTGRWTKAYRGSASAESQRAAGKTKLRVEGVSATVPYLGKLEKVLETMETGVQSALSYSGARNIKELQEKASFIVVSNNSHIEGTPHVNRR